MAGGDSPWYLTRIGVVDDTNSQIRLRYGDNLIGRAEDADIVVTSIFASRRHCKITVPTEEEGGCLTLTDFKTSNGTYIDKLRLIGDRRFYDQLHHNSRIGIGCWSETWTAGEKDQFFIYSLNRDRIITDTVIDLVDDDEDDDNDVAIVDDTIQCQHKDNNVDAVAILPADVQSVAVNRDVEPQPTINGVENNNNENVVGEEVVEEEMMGNGEHQSNDDNDEEDHSLMDNWLEMKKEATQTDDDFIVLSCDDEDDEITNKWAMKLSQNCKIEKIEPVSEEELNNSFLDYIGDNENIVEDINIKPYDEKIPLNEIVAYERRVTEEDLIAQYANILKPCTVKIHKLSDKMVQYWTSKSDNKSKKRIRSHSNSTHKQSESLSKPSRHTIDNEIEPHRKPIDTRRPSIIDKNHAIQSNTSISFERENTNRKDLLYYDEVSSDDDFFKSKYSKLKKIKVSNAVEVPSPVTSPVTERIINDVYPSTSAESNHVNRTKSGPIVIEALPIQTHKQRRMSEVSNKISLENVGAVIKAVQRKQTKFIVAEKFERRTADLKKKWSEPSRSSKSMSYADIKNKRNMEKIREERKAKLKEIADAKEQEAVQQASRVRDANKPTSVPKVKITENNRGAFLADQLPCVIQKRRLSRSNSISAREIIFGVPESDVPKTSKSDEKPADRGSNKENNTETPIEIPSTVKPLKVRKSHVPDIRVEPLLKSVLKKENSVKKSKKNVRFNANVDYCYFESEYSERNLIKPDKISTLAKDGIVSARMVTENKKVHKHRVSKEVINKQIDNVLNDILSWKIQWLKEKDSNKISKLATTTKHLPMLQNFTHVDDYKRILLPIMKMEILEMLRREYQKCHPFLKQALVIHHLNGILRGGSARHVYTCQMLDTNIKSGYIDYLKAGNLLIVEHNRISCFAYITKWTTEDCGTHYITFEVKKSSTTDKIIVNTLVEITGVTSIRMEMSSFEAVFNLVNTEFCEYIISPLIKTPSRIQNENGIGRSSASLVINMKPPMQLNHDQRLIVVETVKLCERKEKPNLLMIEGPPGTGKSHVVTAIVTEVIQRKLPPNELKFLICSQSNAAIDTITERLIAQRKLTTGNNSNLRLIRFGVEEKMSPISRLYSSQNLSNKIFKQHLRRPSDTNPLGVMTSEANEKKLLNEQIKNLEKNGNKNTSDMDRLRTLKEKLARLLQALGETSGAMDSNRLQRMREKESELIQGANVLCTTLSSCINLTRFVKDFDVCIVDEATKCTEPWSLVPLQFNISTFILIGDTQQLPALILSKTAKELGLDTSLFSRIENSFKGTSFNPVVSLTRQYRMHPEICEFPNKYFYNYRLVTDLNIIDNSFPLKPYSIISLNSVQRTNDPRNNTNVDEAIFIGTLIEEIIKLLSSSKKRHTIGVITPYQDQREKINSVLSKRNLINYPINVDTIDSYQGREENIIVLSTARTCNVGFIRDPQRLNVALTRAKDCMIICGNFTSFYSVPVWRQLLDNGRKRDLFYNYDPTKHSIDILMKMLKKVNVN